MTRAERKLVEGALWYAGEYDRGHVPHPLGHVTANLRAASAAVAAERNTDLRACADVAEANYRKGD